MVADSGLGHLENLCAADVDGGLAALQRLDYVSWRERRLPPGKRTTWKGLLRPFPVTSQDTGARHDLRTAYIWSSEEAASAAAARERALTSAEAALTRIRNGLGGRYYKTRRQVDDRVAQILTGQAADLLAVRTGTRDGKPWITWARAAGATAGAARLDGLYALATNLPDPGDGIPLTAAGVLKIYKDQWIAEQRHRDLKQTLKVRPVFLHNDDRIEALIAVIGIALLIFGLIEAELRAAPCPASCPRAAPPGPPPAPPWPPSTAST